MASKFKIGDLVWAKMKGFPAWPGRVIEPKPEVKKPSDKKIRQFVFFYGSENYAFVLEDQMWNFVEFKSKYMITQRVPKGFKEAVEAIEDAVKAQPTMKEEKPEKKREVAKPPKKRAVSPAVSPSSAKKAKVSTRYPMSPTKSATSAASAVTSTTEPSIRDQNDAYDFFDDFLHSQKKEEDVVSDVSPAVADAAPAKNVIATPMKIGFLGLGIMGSGMVNNLLISGHEVTVWNRSPAKCREFVKDCALKGNSPAEVVQQCDITFSCVSDPSALKDLVFGNGGVLQGISQGKAYVDMSTVDVDTITDVHEAVTARGGRFLEAPVIGSRQPSENGSLIILAAGDRTLYDDCYSCFEAMGRKTFYLGETGSAAKMKLVTNMLMGSVLAGLAESLALAEKVGLEQDEVLQILELSPVACPFIKTKGQAMIRSDFSTNFSLENQQKDLRLVVSLADQVDQPLHVAAAVNEVRAAVYWTVVYYLQYTVLLTTTFFISYRSREVYTPRETRGETCKTSHSLFKITHVLR